MHVFRTLDEVAAAANSHIGTSEWVAVEQDRVDQFAAVTGDDQWIHVDVDRAAVSAFGGTIAHGYLTLSLLPWMSRQIYRFETPGARLNYGVNKVRFPTPVRVGSQVRLDVSFGEVVALAHGTQLTLLHRLDVEGQSKPACVAETLVLFTA